MASSAPIAWGQAAVLADKESSHFALEEATFD